MHLKTIAFTTTALTVLSLSTAAMANSNTVYLVQEGIDNAALVDQSQATNSAVGGLDGGPFPARQTGDNNLIEFSQSGDFNRIGTEGDGFVQEGPQNEALITQIDGGNIVGQVRQTSTGGGLSNAIDIDQTGTADGSGTVTNEVGSVVQNSTGAGGAPNRITIAQSRTNQDGESANLIGNVVQDGSQNLIDVAQFGNNNVLNSLSQVNDNNVAMLVMEGDGNYVDQIYQGHPAAGFGINNSVDVAILGNNNGRDLDGISPGTFSGPASEVSATQGVVGQNGGFNTVGLTINGDNNLFGVFQSGQNNRADTLNVNGFDNQLGVVQLFENNVANVDIQSGDGNNVGIRQDTTNFGLAGNTANVNLVGFTRENTVSVMQIQPGNTATVMATGEMNQIDLDQSGGNSNAYVNVQTSGNMVEGMQSSSNSSLDVNINGAMGFNVVMSTQMGGTNNTAFVEISGDQNNYGGMPFQGVAGFVAGSNGMDAGSLMQAGSNNVLEARIGTNGGFASDNLFATLQQGNDNRAVVTMTDGSSNNQVALVQTGDFNIANVTQSGMGNSAGILQ